MDSLDFRVLVLAVAILLIWIANGRDDDDPD